MLRKVTGRDGEVDRDMLAGNNDRLKGMLIRAMVLLIHNNSVAGIVAVVYC